MGGGAQGTFGAHCNSAGVNCSSNNAAGASTRTPHLGEVVQANRLQQVCGALKGGAMFQQRVDA